MEEKLKKKKKRRTWLLLSMVEKAYRSYEAEAGTFGMDQGEHDPELGGPCEERGGEPGE